MPQASRWAMFALAAPVVATIAAIVALAAIDGSGDAPWSRDRPRNIAEAAALGRPADVARFLYDGDSPTQLYAVRPPTFAPTTVYATAFEGAVWSGDAGMLALLEREDARLDETMRTELACLSIDLDRGSTTRYLAPNGLPVCEPGQALAALTARSVGGGR